MKKQNKSWKELPIGSVIEEAGNNKKVSRADWREFRPVHIPEKCTNCLICWSVCPDTAINVKNEKFDRINYNHCKGCLICVTECPFKALKGEKEE